MMQTFYDDIGVPLRVQRNEMTTYPQILTPPMSSEGSQSPRSYTNLSPYSGASTSSPPHSIAPTYFNQMSISEIVNQPNLQIIEQPVDKFRFRYKSEMAGTHGCLNGQTTQNQSERAKKQTYPTVKLNNYSNDAIIRCSLFQYKPDIDEDEWKPHAHRLVQKSINGGDEVDDPHDITVNMRNNHTAKFHNMGIIHTAKKFLAAELIKKNRKLKQEEYARREPHFNNLGTAEGVEIAREAQDDARSINLNTVCLRFDAFLKNNNALYPICEPVFSHPINNLKSALTGELKIARMDNCSSPANGNREIYLLVEKVTKKNIKVRFFELDDNDQEAWSAYGSFSELDVHHQYAIVFKTPPYRDINIETTRKVYIELERPSDGARSEPRAFSYYPQKLTIPGSKRQRGGDSSSYSFNSGDIPSTIPGLETHKLTVDSEELLRYANEISSREFAVFLETSIEPMESICTQPFAQIDTLYCSTNDGPQISKTDRDHIARVCSELVSLIKTKPPRARVIQMMDNWFKNVLNADKNNALHLTVLCYNNDKDIHLNLLLNLILLIRQTHIFDYQNIYGETALHLAVRYEKFNIIEKLINLNAKTNIKDQDGCTPVHISVVKNSIKLIVKSHNIKSGIDLENNDGYTALQLAVKTSNFDAVTVLCHAGANVNIIDKKNGFTILHTAIQEQSIKIVEFLLECTQINLTMTDYNDSVPQKIAKIMTQNGKIESIRILELLETKLKSTGVFSELFIKDEPESDSEDMELDFSEEPMAERLTPEKLESLYAKITEFKSDVIAKVAQIMDYNGKWKELAKLLELDHLLRTNLFDNAISPTKTLISCAITSGDTIYSIRKCLQELNESRAVQVLDDLAFDFSN